MSANSRHPTKCHRLENTAALLVLYQVCNLLMSSELLLTGFRIDPLSENQEHRISCAHFKIFIKIKWQAFNLQPCPSVQDKISLQYKKRKPVIFFFCKNIKLQVNSGNWSQSHIRISHPNCPQFYLSSSQTSYFFQLQLYDNLPHYASL